MPKCQFVQNRQLFLLLFSLIDAEKSYYNLGFMSTKKIFLRKDVSYIIGNQYIYLSEIKIFNSLMSALLNVSIPSQRTLNIYFHFKIMFQNSLKSMYTFMCDTLRSDLSKLEDTNSQDQTINDLIAQLVQYLSARIQLIELYPFESMFACE